MPPVPSVVSTHVSDGLARLTDMFKRPAPERVLCLESDETNALVSEDGVSLAVE